MTPIQDIEVNDAAEVDVEPSAAVIGPEPRSLGFEEGELSQWRERVLAQIWEYGRTH